MPSVAGTPPITVRRVAAGRGMAWWGDSFALLFADLNGLGIWIAMALCTLAAQSLLQAVPVLGWIGSVFLNVLLQGGLMIAAQATARDGKTRFEDLFGGFSRSTSALLVLGLLSLLAFAAWAGILLLAGASALLAAIGSAWSGSSLTFDGSIGPGVLWTLFGLVALALVLLLPILMAFWLAPALVVLGGASPLDAVRLSFLACLRNALAMIVYDLIFVLLILAAVIPLFLGLLILLPLISLSTYAIYREVFAPAEASAAITAP